MKTYKCLKCEEDNFSLEEEVLECGACESIDLDLIEETSHCCDAPLNDYNICLECKEHC